MHTTPWKCVCPIKYVVVDTIHLHTILSTLFCWLYLKWNAIKTEMKFSAIEPEYCCIIRQMVAGFRFHLNKSSTTNCIVSFPYAFTRYDFCVLYSRSLRIPHNRYIQWCDLMCSCRQMVHHKPLTCPKPCFQWKLWNGWFWTHCTSLFGAKTRHIHTHTRIKR